MIGADYDDIDPQEAFKYWEQTEWQTKAFIDAITSIADAIAHLGKAQAAFADLKIQISKNEVLSAAERINWAIEHIDDFAAEFALNEENFEEELKKWRESTKSS